MAIWSLTKERVDKLLKQIGEKQTEIDELIKLSKEDIWNKDLDDFMNEWNFQLADDIARRKQIQGMKRRVSSKLKVQGKPARQRKGGESDDEDFGTRKQKKAKEAPKGILGYVQKKSPPKKVDKKIVSKEEPKPVEKDVWMSLDDEADDVVPAPKAKTIPTKPPAPEKPKVVQADSDDEPVVPIPSRGRAAARKPVNYGIMSDSDMESDGDFDVSKMVKGIGESTSTTAARPLFSATTLSRPGSSAGLVARKSIGVHNRTIVDGDNSADDTDYTRLAPVSNGTKQATAAKATILSDDDSMELGMTAPAPVPAPATTALAQKKRGRAPAAATATAKPKPAPKATKAAAAAKPVREMKQTTLSPAAKAYANKQKTAKAAASAKKPVSSSDLDEDSEVEKIANDMLSDDDDGDDDGEDEIVAARPAARPARRAAAQTKKAWVVESEDEDEGDVDELDESLGFEEEGDSE